jgi:hypothetical protein
MTKLRWISHPGPLVLSSRPYLRRPTKQVPIYGVLARDFRVFPGIALALMLVGPFVLGSFLHFWACWEREMRKGGRRNGGLELRLS